MLFQDRDAYLRHQSETREIQGYRAVLTRECISGGEAFRVHAFCDVCSRHEALLVDYLYAAGGDQACEPNWRERLVCSCGLNNRMRAALHVFRVLCQPASDDPIYATEQVTPLYRQLAARFSRTTGSEYLGSTIPFGSLRYDGVRNESVTSLSFADGSFKHVLSFDVLEHVPDYARGLSEVHRVLEMGGNFLFSVPFLANVQETLVRARVSQAGEIEHLLPPEYHGDPLAAEGCLCFHHFGWDVLDSCRQAGFSQAFAVAVWSREFGYLGPEQLFFLARK